MAAIEWSDKFSVCVPELDEHHQHIVSMLARLENAVEEADVVMDHVNQVLDDMVDYMEYHFTAEEKYMAQIDYPDFRTHRSEHESFLKETYKFLGKVRKGKALEARELSRFLQSWILNHILTMDKKYELFASQTSPT